MIRLHKISKIKYPDADYTFVDTDKFYDLLRVLTPKFSGNWKILIIDPDIKFVSDLLSNNKDLDFVEINIYVAESKLNIIVLENPSYAPKSESVWDSYQKLISQLPCLMESKAVRELYHAIGPNLEELQGALNNLSATGTSEITVNDVRKTYPRNKVIYASQVLDAFLKHDKNRWRLANSYISDLGEQLAYYAIFKQVRLALQAKNDYLHNIEIKNQLSKKYDAPLLCYCYVIFNNSQNHKNLYGLLSAIDSRSSKTLSAITEDL